jgi:tRNA-dihydrouridine synthase
LAADFPNLRFSLNGGLETLGDCQKHLRAHLDAPTGASGSTSAARLGPLHGVMLGRAAVARPWHLLASVDELLYDEPPPMNDGAYLTRRQVIAAYSVYAEAQLERCRRVQPAYARKLCRQLVKPVANLFAGEPGGARFRQVLEEALQADAFNRAGAAGGVAAVLEAACGVLHPHVLDAPPPHVLLAAQLTAEQEEAANPFKLAQ